ncbi:MAG: HlyD family efflux transporter periplasmic adaptor subunit [Candidatus Eremiobacteraeota bacterium]|nr:HlyD family efflux transporter periplasmic adaptor subunit [Candidatus Eremiobacteraeota bacterium]MCW5872102.1 HlyD family efflux transporter periplasmic adaptor subunit [Candidatus Eremiobacteraeota bacterium]
MKTRSLLLSLALAGCGAPKASKPAAHTTPPASVLQISKETELATVRLSEKAEQRLGISTAPVRRQSVLNRRPYPGIVVVPPQNLTTLVAPITGTLSSPRLTVGSRVNQGEHLFSFTPLLVDNYALGPSQQLSLKTSELSLKQSEVAIQTRINNAKVEVEASLIDFRRAEQLYQEQVGSRKRMDDARARWQLAQEVLESARRELHSVQQVTQPSSLPEVRPVTQASPLSGTISKVLVASGQAVSAGQPLLEIMNLKTLWLRVRIPQAEAAEIERGQPATLPGGRQAQPTKGAPTGDQLTSSLDLYFQLQNYGLNPDQRVEVWLPLKGSGQHLVVPSAAILYDIYGGSWVYARTQSHEYHRERVLVDHSTDDGLAVLAKGPAVGTTVVVNGAAELFGVEFGAD